jgi:hypothetical protein
MPMKTRIRKSLKTVKSRYAKSFEQEKFIRNFLFSIVLLIGSLIVNYFASAYATRSVSNPVSDIILSNIRVFNVDIMFVYGPFLLWICVAIFLFINPSKMPFTIKSITLFILIRAVFISLTHIGPFPINIFPGSESDIIKYFTLGGDLFFSAHTGLPFLLALIFWKSWWPRVLFIATSIFFGIIVLLGHYHYSIDVLAAFFITHSIYRMSLYLFSRDYDYFCYGSVNVSPENYAL